MKRITLMVMVVLLIAATTGAAGEVANVVETK